MISLAETLYTLELGLARRDERALPGGYAAVLDADFMEIGASGRTWTRDETLAMLAQVGRPVELTISEFEVAALAQDVWLATYRLRGAGPDAAAGQSRRSSIWCRRDDAWRMRFHQGTPVPTGMG